MITADDKLKQADTIDMQALHKRKWGYALIAEADQDMVKASILREEARREQKAAELYT